MEISHRIQQLMKHKELTQKKLGDLVGYSDVAVGKLASGVNEPRLGFLAGVLREFPDVNPRWLLLGEGPMLGEIVKNSLSDYSEMEIINHIEDNEEEFFKIKQMTRMLKRVKKENYLMEVYEDVKRIKEELSNKLGGDSPEDDGDNDDGDED